MMWKGRLGGLLAALGAVCVMPATAQEQASAEQLVASLSFRDGEIAVPQANAYFRLKPEVRYLDKADARRVLEQLWDNPPDDSVLGMIVPAKPTLLEDASWAVVVTYSDDGYVSDEDAAKIDYDQMLADMQDGRKEDNAARREAGYGTVDLLGWAVPPRYDSASKKLYWAKELVFDGNPDHTVNYDIRVLGRRGYLSLNAVAGMPELPVVQTGMQQLLTMTEFDAGARYADFDESTDKVAAYGVAALIGGGLAAKASLFAKLWLILAKFWKLLLIGIIGVGVLARRMFGGSKDQSTVL